MKNLWIYRLNNKLMNRTSQMTGEADKNFKMTIFNGDIFSKFDSLASIFNDYDIGGVSSGNLGLTPEKNFQLKGHISTRYFENMDTTPCLGIYIQVR